MTDWNETSVVHAARPAPVALDEARAAVIRDRIARGFYRTEWVQNQIAARLLASGDLREPPSR